MKPETHGTDLHPLSKLDQIIHAPARLMIISYLYVVESADYVFLMKMTGLTWGNLATHLIKLEEAGYIKIEKSFQGKKPRSTLLLTIKGRKAFIEYKDLVIGVLENLPE